MKKILLASSLCIFTSTSFANAEPMQQKLYINKNLGFNIAGFKYTQSEIPCEIDQQLVAMLTEEAKNKGINAEPVSTAAKIRNGVIPVLAIDIEELVLNKDFKFGSKTRSNLPQIKVTAGIFNSDAIQTQEHSCSIATLNELTPSSNVLDMGTVTTVCSAMHKCLKDLSKDIAAWVELPIQKNPSN